MPRQITAAVFTPDSGDNCVFQTLMLAAPDENEIVIRVRASGICHTDVSAAVGFPRPSVLGHETAGEVVEVGAKVTEFVVGDRVVSTFASCGDCPSCHSAEPAYCWSHNALNSSGLRPNGNPALCDQAGQPIYGSFFQQSGFADHIIAQASNTVKIPSNLAFTDAAPLGCGVQTGFGAISNVLKPDPKSSVAIFGCGAVGLSAIIAAKIAGCAPIIAVDVIQSRLTLAGELGATHALSGQDANLVNTIRDISSGGADYAVDSSGVLAAFQAAISCLRPRGTCGALTFPGRYDEEVLHPGGHAFLSTNLVGIIEGNSDPKTFLPYLASLQSNPSFGFQKMIQTYRFEDINAALTAMRDKTVVKPVLTFD